MPRPHRSGGAIPSLVFAKETIIWQQHNRQPDAKLTVSKWIWFGFFSKVATPPLRPMFVAGNIVW
jgi:hypothetical protein